MIACSWALGSENMLAYHDTEWGVPEHDDRKLFEFIVLEGAQAGLSWKTILDKRAGYREAFAEFDAAKVARFSEAKVEKLMTNPAIVRNRLKITSTITNAQRVLAMVKEHGSLDAYLWSFVDGRPIQNRRQGMGDIPASTPESDRMSKTMKRDGFRFVGTTICYAHMQATGMVNDHAVTCPRHAAVVALG